MKKKAVLNLFLTLMTMSGCTSLQVAFLISDGSYVCKLVLQFWLHEFDDAKTQAQGYLPNWHSLNWKILVDWVRATSPGQLRTSVTVYPEKNT